MKAAILFEAKIASAQARGSSVSVPPPGVSGPVLRGDTLMAQPFDGEKGEPRGEIVPVAEQVGNLVGTASWAFSASANGVLVYTVHPDHLAASALTNLDVVLAVGPAPERVLGAFSRHLHRAAPNAPPTVLEKGEILAWFPEQSQLRRLRFRLAQADLRRHKRNYAHGELGEDRSFYFRGPEEKLNLRAQNLDMFLQLADGVDDDTWLYHLNRGDYSKWVRDRIKDEP